MDPDTKRSPARMVGYETFMAVVTGVYAVGLEHIGRVGLGAGPWIEALVLGFWLV